MTTENKKIFSPKVIIGSITSFIATIVGIIAVFFPDLLNLQKEKIEKLSMVVETVEQSKEFVKFLDEREKDGKVFELEILFCSDNESIEVEPYDNPELDSYYLYYPLNDHISIMDEVSVTITAINPLGKGFTSLDDIKQGKYGNCYENEQYESSCGVDHYYLGMQDGMFRSLRSPDKPNMSEKLHCTTHRPVAYLEGLFAYDGKKIGLMGYSKQRSFDSISFSQLRLKNY